MPSYFYIAVYDMGDGDGPAEIEFTHCLIDAPNEAFAYESGRAKMSEEDDAGGLLVGEYIIGVPK